VQDGRVTDDPLERAVAAILAGDVDELGALLAADPSLATARVHDRTLLHVVADWPGHRPRGAEAVAVLVAAGADVDAPFSGGQHEERPLHWAASSNDLAVLDALLEAGADIDAPGAVAGGGTPLMDAVVFAQWDAAVRLVERGATTDLFTSAALGLMGRLRALVDRPGLIGLPLDDALWAACHGGRLEAARYLRDRGAALHRRAPWDGTRPHDAAVAGGHAEVAEWLRSEGASPS
jgi:uncharacterized protein